MANIKDAATIAKKYASRGQAAGQDYTDGINNSADWAANTAAAADTYAAGVQAAIGRGDFAKGVAAAGNEKFKRKAAGVGATRYGPGVSAAAPDYAKGVGPYLDVLRNLSYPKRLPKGDPGNNARSLVVQQALRAAKVGR
jgi:hypothetical protein